MTLEMQHSDRSGAARFEATSFRVVTLRAPSMRHRALLMMQDLEHHAVGVAWWSAEPRQKMRFLTSAAEVCANAGLETLAEDELPTPQQCSRRWEP